MIKCRACDSDKNIELHHLFPKSFGGRDEDGRMYLCALCHHSLHKQLSALFKAQIIKVSKDYIEYMKNEKDRHDNSQPT
jgi:5-methylcytosine-specific restriction endonuclease McrA